MSTVERRCITAVLSKDVQVVRDLLAIGAAPDAQDKHGWTPLMAAAQDYLVEAAAVLLAAGAAVDPVDDYGNTPLSRAVFESCGRGNMITLLRKHGADLNHKNRQDVSPLELANTIANYDVKQWMQP